jgi:hypothetical protein
MKTMHLVGSYPLLIDNIVNDLENASRIRIECQSAEKTKFPAHPGLQITAISNCNSACNFLHYMEHVRAETMNKLRETLPQIAPADRETFIDQLLRRVRKATLSVTMTGSPGSANKPYRKFQWAIRHVICLYQGQRTYEPTIMTEAVALTCRHAMIYYLVLKKLEDRINSCAGSALNILATSSVNPVSTHSQKFRLSCTVAFFCAMLRVMCDRNILENPNVSELCRRMAAACCTNRQENLSPHSLRNCFDDPSPAVLEELLKEVMLWEKYILKFIHRQQH